MLKRIDLAVSKEVCYKSSTTIIIISWFIDQNVFT